MKISVCMAVYNGEKFIHAQIQSILNQIDDDDELIIIDDCSSDSSVSIIKSFDSSKIKLFFNTLNVGPQKSFERALELSSGDIIFFSDQDDIWIDGKVIAFVQAFRETKAAAVVSDAKIIDQNGKIKVESFFVHRNSGSGFVRNFIRNTYLGCCMAIDNRVKKWVLPFPNGITQHDEWIGLICDFVDKVVFLQEPLTLYRRHTTNASSERSLPIHFVVRNRIKMGFYLAKEFIRLLKSRILNSKENNE
jgi:glycosyltransferase involved in cell wall biosynthesis